MESLTLCNTDMDFHRCQDAEMLMTEQKFKGKSTTFEWGCKGYLKIEILKGIGCHLLKTGQKDTKLGLQTSNQHSQDIVSFLINMNVCPNI